MASHIFFFVTLMLSITLATSLNCYACNKAACKSRSFTKIDCNAPTGNPIVDTVKAAMTPLCVKLEGIDSTGNPFEERNCTANLGPTSCSLLVNTITLVEKSKNVQCHTCDSNYCNSGTTLFSTFTLLLSSALFYF